MFTVILALIHSRSKNPNFNPDFEYSITLFIDFIMVIGILLIAAEIV